MLVFRWQKYTILLIYFSAEMDAEVNREAVSTQRAKVVLK